MSSVCVVLGGKNGPVVPTWWCGVIVPCGYQRRVHLCECVAVCAPRSLRDAAAQSWMGSRCARRCVYLAAIGDVCGTAGRGDRKAFTQIEWADRCCWPRALVSASRFTSGPRVSHSACFPPRFRIAGSLCAGPRCLRDIVSVWPEGFRPGLQGNVAYCTLEQGTCERITCNTPL